MLRRVLVCAFVAAACAAAAAKDASEDSKKQLFEKVDSNHDGVIDSNEFKVLGDQDKTGMVSTALKALTKGAGFMPALLNSITMTIATELGDKTFCIAAVLSMRFSRLAVFGGAIGALIVMTILSVGIGVALPALISKQYTHYAAGLLFAYFGLYLLREGYNMPAGGGDHEELAEAEQEIADKIGGVGASSGGASAGGEDSPATGAAAVAPRLPSTPSSAGNGSVEAGDDADPGAKSVVAKRAVGGASGGGLSGLGSARGVKQLKEWAIFTQAFTMTFLAEWGDRSQIATIAMAAAQDAYGVCLGAVIGHSLCTGLAVLGGRLLATRISERAVALAGGALFILFAVHSMVAGPDVDE